MRDLDIDPITTVQHLKRELGPEATPEGKEDGLRSFSMHLSS